MLYDSNQIQEMINKIKKDVKTKDRFLESLKCSESDKRAIRDVLSEGYYERFDRYDSDVSEIFIDAYEKFSTKSKKEQWKEKAIDNQKKAKELILSVSQNYTTDPNSIAELLAFGSKFHKYSIGNIELIYAQNKNVTFFQSFEAWKKMDAHVNKGEKGLKIWVPVKATVIFPEEGVSILLSEATAAQKKAFEDGLIPGKKILRFSVGNVFDISQTDFPKEKLPAYYNMGYASEDHNLISNGLIKFSESQGCKVYSLDLSSIALRGQYQYGRNQIVLSNMLEDTERLSTLSHELGHMLQKHGTTDASTAQKEFEADSISVLIETRYGIELTESRKEHLAHHYKAFADELRQTNQSITNEEIIKSVESVLEASMAVFRKFADEMDNYVEHELNNASKSLLENENSLQYYFEVNECSEFPEMGASYAEINDAKEAISIYMSIPEDRKMLVGGINLVGINISGEKMEEIPLSVGHKMDLSMTDYYPGIKDNAAAIDKIKSFIDEAVSSKFEVYGEAKLLSEKNNYYQHLSKGVRHY